MFCALTCATTVWTTMYMLRHGCSVQRTYKLYVQHAVCALMLWQALICIAGVMYVSALLCQSQTKLRLPRARKEVPPSVRL